MYMDNELIKVLLVEDDEIDRRLAKRALTMCSQPVKFDIEPVETMSAAIEHLSSSQYDVVLLDMGLPDSSGLETIQKVSEVNSHAPIVVLTGFDDEQTGLSAIKSGAADYLVKGPSLGDSLVRTILYALERKKAAFILRLAEERYRTIFENSAIAITMADEQERLISWNKFTEDLLGMDRGDLHLNPVKFLYPEHEWEKIKTHDVRQRGMQYHFETKMIKKNGEIIDVDLSLSILKNPEGKTTGSVGVFRDITERKKTRLELQLAEEKYRTIFENSAVAIMMADEQERLISWNKFAENLLGVNGESLHLRTISSFYPQEEWEKIKAHDVRQKGMQHHLETRMIKADGEVIDVDLSLSVLKNHEDQITGSIGVIKNITERKRAEEKLKEAMRIKSEFISMVSHELRTPLATVKEDLAIVLDEAAGKVTGKQRHFLEAAERNLNRLVRLINDVLDFQKLDSGRMKFNMQENDINEVVKGVHKTMASSVKGEGLDFSVKLEDNLPKLKFGSDKIIQVLTNVVNNAIKFTEKGSITIATRRIENVIQVSISDTGCGIKQEDMPRLFHKFEQLATGGDRKTGGTGLGLAISKEIIEEHGGKIWAKSKFGSGTTLHFLLPIIERRVKPREES